MNHHALVCLAEGSEEIEAVTTIDLLVRAGITVTTAAISEQPSVNVVCSRGVKLIADALLDEVVEDAFDVLILPGGLAGSLHFQKSALIIEKIRQMQMDKKLVAAICAVPALVLEYHALYPIATMTGHPNLKNKISPEKWVDKRVCYDARVQLITSQGPATSFDFALKIIEVLAGKQKAAEVIPELILPAGVYTYSN